MHFENKYYLIKRIAKLNIILRIEIKKSIFYAADEISIYYKSLKENHCVCFVMNLFNNFFFTFLVYMIAKSNTLYR